MLFYSNSISNRLQYITRFISKELKLDPFGVTTSVEKYKNYNGPRINYSDARMADGEFWIKPHNLLFQKGIVDQKTDCFDTGNGKGFFKVEGDHPFDIFAACFYLLSRYEEYLLHKKDMYGRYAYENSIAYREGFLDKPLINTWLQEFSGALNKKFHSLVRQADDSPKHPPFVFLPTYDIDMAWSYKYKGWRRNAGGFIRDLIKGEWFSIRERIRVLNGKQKDPFDAFGWMNQLHERYKLKPYYFFLVPQKRGRFDKNIPPSCKAMQELIHDQVLRYPVGVHPSWRSGDDVSLLKEEIAVLSQLAGSQIVSSRQHYIRFNLPGGYRRLIENGIQFDFSMGYGSINGFRASIATPFYWYDLEKEEQTGLLLFPFCYMEANSFYEEKLTARQALEEMRHYYNEVKSVNGYFIMIWHNSFLGTARLYAGWKEAYEQFISEVSPANG